jgi:cobalt-zinc-cadmium efflux system outer membrane protein
VRLRARERIPNPTLRLGYERERTHLSVPGAGTAQDSDTRLLASVSIPLPLWYQGQGELRAARAERQATKVEREAAERQAETEVAAAFAAVRQSQRALEAMTAVLPRVERNLELIRRAFEAGQVDLFSLLNARDRALQTRQEFVEARVEYGRALDALMRATGQLPLEGKP